MSDNKLSYRFHEESLTEFTASEGEDGCVSQRNQLSHLLRIHNSTLHVDVTKYKLEYH